MKAFDPNYKLLDEMYQDEYYPDFLVDKVKEELSATSRCMPFEQEELSDVCVCCGKKAKKMVVWGKAY